MTVKLNAYLFGEQVPDLKEALRYKKLNYDSHLLIHPEGADFMFVSRNVGRYSNFLIYSIPEGMSIKDFDNLTWPIITGRDINAYGKHFVCAPRFGHKKFLKNILKKGGDKTWFIVGPGMDQLTPHLAEIKESSGNYGPVLISEPLNYGLMDDSLVTLRDYMVSNEFTEPYLIDVDPEGTVDEARRRIRIITESPKIVRWKGRFGISRPPERIREHKGHVYAVVDFQAAKEHSIDPRGTEEKLKKFLHPDYSDNFFIF
ncbi:MAG: hypothetical protein JW754_02575 [Candidatus Aenigmarchaeota archaeon]|nr:hypothetical protein [Candidatus Aenigmarchaeota archaeon]